MRYWFFYFFLRSRGQGDISFHVFFIRVRRGEVNKNTILFRLSNTFRLMNVVLLMILPRMLKVRSIR